MILLDSQSLKNSGGSQLDGGLIVYQFELASGFVEILQRLGLLMVNLEPVENRVGVIVFSLDQLGAASVALVFLRRLFVCPL